MLSYTIKWAYFCNDKDNTIMIQYIHTSQEQRDQLLYQYINPSCANRNKSRLLFSSAEIFKKPLWQAVCPIGAVCCGSTLFPFILIWSVILDNYLQQTTSAEDIFRCIFS